MNTKPRTSRYDQGTLTSPEKSQLFQENQKFKATNEEHRGRFKTATINWTASAQVLLESRKGHDVEDLYYRAYLRAIISENPSQAKHLTSKFRGAKEAQQDLIDHVGSVRTASRGTYVPMKDLPKLIVDELKGIGFNKKDIQVIPTTSFKPQGLSGDGTRAFITLISLIDGRTKTEMGSWGGANMFESKQVDVDDRDRPLPKDYAVIKGSTGGYVFAELLVHPDNLAKFLPSGESVELTDKEKLALKAIATLTSSGRKDAFGYNRLGQYRPENPLIQSLISKGLVKAVGSGVSITTDGKNVASGLPQIY